MHTAMALEGGLKVALSQRAVADNTSWPPEPEAALRWKPVTRRAKGKRFGNEGAV